MSIGRIITAAVALICLSLPLDGHAAPRRGIKVLCSTALKGVMVELVPRFERAGEREVAIEFAPSSVLKDRIDAGEPFDLTVLTPGLVDEMIAKGRITAVSRTAIARTGLGLAVHAGAPKPDLRTVDALRAALLAARSIAFGTQGASAAPFAALVERLGVTAALEPKYVRMTTGASVGEAVADGRAEFGVLPISEIILLPGVELGGGLPAEAQTYLSMVAGVGARATDADLAKDLIVFLMASQNRDLYRVKGMERF
jgi:molybdate transport system substrate-binding protein